MELKNDPMTELFTLCKAGYPALSINSAERVRVVEVIRRAGWQMCHGRKVANSGETKELFDAIAKAHPEAEPVCTQDGGKLVLDANALVTRKHLLANSDKEDHEKLSENLEQFLNDNSYPVITWDTVVGFSHILPEAKVDNPVELYEAFMLLRVTEAFPLKAIFVFHDCHEYVGGADPRYRAMFRSLVEANSLVTKAMRRHIIFVQPHWQVHTDIVHAITPVDFPPPEDEQLQREIDYVSVSLPADKRTCPAELRWELVKAMRGLTTVEATNALSYCLVRYGGWTANMVTTMHKLTAAALAKNDVLEIIPDDKLASSEQIGGFENYLDTLREYKECYSMEALKVGLKRPKGCLLLGIPGTGKSLVAMATARLMRLPLIKYDFAAVFNQLVGQSEATQRQALRQVSARGPCVLLIDEADKAFSGIIGSSGDSGVGQRVFGRLLSWMANENDSAFVVMTMNRIVDPNTGAQIVPIETLRAGRIETVWYTTYPDEVERDSILTIHLLKNGAFKQADHVKLAYDSADWEKLIKETHEYVGSELEQVVVKAVRTAFVNRKVLQPTFKELLEAKAYVTPVAKLDEANIKAINRFCTDRAVPVSKPKKAKVSTGRKGRNLDLGSEAN